MNATSLRPALVALLMSALAGAASAQGFNALAARDSLDVWAVGDAGAVYRSLDGGATWGSYPLGSAEHRGVAAHGARVWIVDADGALWTSENSGYSFASTAPAGGTPLNAVCFATPLAGWVAGGSGTILATADGGQNWTPQVSGTAADLHAIRFRDAMEGWACGAGGTVLHTVDGGASWSPPAGAPGFAKDLYDIACAGDTVWIAGTYAFLARSADAGASWTPIDLEITSKSDVNGVELLPGGTLWLCGGGGFLRSTQDGGAHWFFPQHKVMSGITDLCFSDARHGWACAARSKLVASTADGGVTWNIPGGGGFTYAWFQKIANGTSTIRGNTLAIDPVNRDKLYAVQGKYVIASWNLGNTWTVIDTIPGAGSRTNAFLVSASDTNTWLAIVQDGDRVVRTTDGGASWTVPLSKAYTEYGLPLEQDHNNPDHVLFAPEDGRIWESFDFGATWDTLPSQTPRFRSPDDIVVVPDTSGLLYLSDGVTGTGLAQIFRSTDGGRDWTLMKSGPSSELPTIVASPLDNQLGYATNWSAGGVNRTQDMGLTWPAVATTASAWGVDIGRDDPNVVMYAIYSGGQAFLSLDRGATWISAPIGGSNYAVLAYDRSTFLCHQSSGIWKATISQPDMPVDNTQLVALTRPNGGETFRYGDTEPIVWSCQNLASLRLEVQLKPQGPWVPLASDASAPAGSWWWPVEAWATWSARVRVSDANDGAPVDLSDAPFSIVVPGLATAPATLAFGEVNLGSSRTDTVWVENPGTATLVVSSVTVPGGGPFTPNRTSFSMPPAGRDSVLVVFEPSAAQLYQDTLVIAHNAPGPPVQVPLSGTGHDVTAVEPGGEGPPARFAMPENVPNPFGAGGTVIAYSLPEACDVRLDVFDVLGQRVATLTRGRQAAGRYAVRFPGAGQTLAGGYGAALPSGIYFCRLRAGAFVQTRRLALVR